jgi:hypothetical protein
MKISLNSNDMHAAIREFLQRRNIVDEGTELDISIQTLRKGGSTADISIVNNTKEIVVETAEEKPKPFGSKLDGV